MKELRFQLHHQKYCIGSYYIQSFLSLHLVIFIFTFSHLADAFVQSDVQGREQSSYEQ